MRSWLCLVAAVRVSMDLGVRRGDDDHMHIPTPTGFRKNKDAPKEKDVLDDDALYRGDDNGDVSVQIDEDGKLSAIDVTADATEVAGHEKDFEEDLEHSVKTLNSLKSIKERVQILDSDVNDDLATTRTHIHKVITKLWRNLPDEEERREKLGDELETEAEEAKAVLDEEEGTQEARRAPDDVHEHEPLYAKDILDAPPESALAQSLVDPDLQSEGADAASIEARADMADQALDANLDLELDGGVEVEEPMTITKLESAMASTLRSQLPQLAQLADELGDGDDQEAMEWYTAPHESVGA